MPTTTIPSDAPLREMLDHRQLAPRHRRRTPVIEAQRARADAPRSPRRVPCWTTIAGLPAERAAPRSPLEDMNAALGRLPLRAAEHA
jgi:hypothetical protein